jgi:hypothetical protein
VLDLNIEIANVDFLAVTLKELFDLFGETNEITEANAVRACLEAV